jgi:hypothetical protein
MIVEGRVVEGRTVEANVGEQMIVRKNVVEPKIGVNFAQKIETIVAVNLDSTQMGRMVDLSTKGQRMRYGEKATRERTLTAGHTMKAGYMRTGMDFGTFLRIPWVRDGWMERRSEAKRRFREVSRDQKKCVDRGF